MKDSNVRTSPALLAAAALFLGLTLYYFGSLVGAPFVTPDSFSYWKFEGAPAPKYSDYYPALLPTLFSFVRSLGFGPLLTLSLIFSLRLFFVFMLLARKQSPLRATIGCLLLACIPEILLLDLTLWSESTFLLVLTFLALALQIPNRSLRILGVFLGFWALVETRHAGFFFLPALALAAGLSLTGDGRWSSKAFSAISIGVALFLAWGVINVARTGEFLRPTKSYLQCILPIAGYNQLNYCQAQPAPSICALDPQHEFIGNPGKGIAPIVFDKESPLRRIISVDPAAACVAWREVRDTLLREFKLRVFGLISSRIWQQLGAFNETERGRPYYQPQYVWLIDWLDIAFDVSAAISSIFTLVGILGMMLVLAVTRRAPDPVVVFLLVGGLSHAVAIAITNPFLVLRYMAVHHYLLLLGLLYVLPQVARLWNERFGRTGCETTEGVD